MLGVFLTCVFLFRSEIRLNFDVLVLYSPFLCVATNLFLFLWRRLVKLGYPTDAPVADREEMKSVKEGESVTLDPGVMKNTNYLITFLFNDVLIAEISEDQSKTCTDVQCDKGNERFRDRLKLDHQAGSLTITNTRNTDSGEYKLQIIISSSSFSIRRSRSFSLTVTGSGPSLAAVAGICAAVVILLVAAAAGVMYLKQKKRRGAEPNNDQTNTMRYSTVKQTETATIGSSYKRTETATEKPV